MLLFRVLIPANTFQDLEDGDTRDLSLRVVDRDTGRELQQLAWATFQPSTQEILALPTEENIGIYNLQVSAANRLIGEVVQSRRRPLLGPSPG